MLPPRAPFHSLGWQPRVVPGGLRAFSHHPTEHGNLPNVTRVLSNHKRTLSNLTRALFNQLGASAVFERGNFSSDVVETINGVRLLHDLRAVPVVVVKMDIEGSEFAVLTQMMVHGSLCHAVLPCSCVKMAPNLGRPSVQAPPRHSPPVCM
jgi:hypothetical protein